MTIHELQKKLKSFDAKGRGNADAGVLQHAWKSLFGIQMSRESAKSFEAYYKDMKMASTKGKKTRSAQPAMGGKRKGGPMTLKHRKAGHGSRKSRRTQKQRGGAAFTLSGAPLSYGGAAPGLPLATYGDFIKSLAQDGGALDAIPVTMPEPSIPQSPPGYWPSVPGDMGSNKVPQAGGRRHTRKQKGGGLLETLSLRSFLPTVPPSALQTGGTTFAGQLPPPSGRPEVAAWSPQSTGAPLINPGTVASITATEKLANPLPWQEQNPAT